MATAEDARKYLEKYMRNAGIHVTYNRGQQINFRGPDGAIYKIFISKFKNQ